MPQRVEVPGMGILEFPDGMSDDAMAAAIKKNMPDLKAKAPTEPPATLENDVKQYGVGGAKGLIGMVTTPIMPLVSSVEGVRKGGVDIAKAAGANVPEWLDKPIPSAAEIGQHGAEMVTGDFRKPQNMEERFADTLGEFSGGSLSGGGGILRTGARVLGSMIPAATSQTAGELTAGTKYEQIARLLGAGIGIGGQAAGRAVAAPVMSNIRARVDPAGYAGGQVGRMVDESGVPTARVADDISTATREGQGVFTVADALGRAGQRGLSTVARAPGEGRTDVVNFLEGRQGGQAGRVANALAEGFDAPQTAAQTRTRIEGARDTAADAAYGAARNNAGPVDLTQAIARINSTLTPGATRLMTPHSNIANDTAENALQSFRDRLTDGRSNLTDFTAVQRVRGDLSDAIESAQRAGHGNRARLLGQVMREIDTAMEGASPGFRAANRQFAAGSRAMEAVDEGRTAAQRGRSEDVVRDFQGRPQDQQAAFRTGYVDPLIEQTQGAAVGANKARPLTSDAFRAEADAMAPGALTMMRRLGRENTMFETRQQAMGGSRTADNLADAAAAGLNPGVVAGAVLNPRGAVRQLLQASTNVLTGNTAEVRREIARILLMRGENSSPARIREVLDDARRVEIARQLNRNLNYAIPASVAASQGGQNAP